MSSEIESKPETVPPAFRYVKFLIVSRTVATRVPELAEKVSFAAVSVMETATGVANSGVSLAPMMLTVKVPVP